MTMYRVAGLNTLTEKLNKAENEQEKKKEPFAAFLFVSDGLRPREDTDIDQSGLCPKKSSRVQSKLWQTYCYTAN